MPCYWTEGVFALPSLEPFKASSSCQLVKKNGQEDVCCSYNDSVENFLALLSEMHFKLD